MEQEALQLIVLLQAILIENRKAVAASREEARRYLPEVERHRRPLMGALRDAAKLMRASAEIAVAIARINDACGRRIDLLQGNPGFPRTVLPPPPGGVCVENAVQFARPVRRGAPLGNTNRMMHGRYSKAYVARRKAVRERVNAAHAAVARALAWAK
ncbi:MAG: hypothetical protein KGJ79_09180 [Alphaproteobacteria bacterium]|nr:hypothetical protein [Alphaproteobacteria bacterium]MDE2495880.1 hypothetical protein [Alphaproteobacteria bacterium]